jgi:hypothetical protein
VGFADYKQADPIDSTAGMGYPLSVENGRDPAALKIAFPLNGRCSMAEGDCSSSALSSSIQSFAPTGMTEAVVALSSSARHFAPATTVDVVIDSMTTAVEYVEGTGAYLYSSIKMGWSWFTSLAPQTEEPSYLVVNATTTTPVNTLRFNWSFDTAGEGLLRVFVGGDLVREIDQRHVMPSSPVTEEIYIGGVEGPLPAGTHRITFRLDGFGASASGVELTDVELGLTGPTLTVTKIGTGTVTSIPAGIDCGADCSEIYASDTPVTLTAFPATGSTFVGWSGDCAADGTVTLDADKTCTATFNLITYTLTVTKTGTGAGTVTSSPSGITCTATCAASFTSGTIVTLTASPMSESLFTGWSGDCAGTGSCAVTLNAAQSVTATFGPAPPITYPLTVTKAGTGTVTSSPTGINCGATCGTSFTSGTPVTLTATPATGSSFTGWSGACAGSGTVTTCTITLDAAKSVTATFVTRPDLVVTAVTNPPGTARPGGSFSVTATVKNQGLASAGSSTVRYYLSLDGVQGTGDKLLSGSRSVASLAVGASSTGTVTVTIPSSTVSGTYFLLACADDTKVVAESNEGNNCRSSNTQIGVGP